MSSQPKISMAGLEGYGFLNFHAPRQSRHASKRSFLNACFQDIGKIIERQDGETPGPDVFWIEVKLNPLESLENKLLNDVLQADPKTNRLLLLKADNEAQAERLILSLKNYFSKGHRAQVEIMVTTETIEQEKRESLAYKIAERANKLNQFRALQARYDNPRG